MVIFGACGGVGLNSTDTKGMVSGTHYLRQGGSDDILLWGSKIHVRINLTTADSLLIVVGQSGLDGCQKVRLPPPHTLSVYVQR